MSHADEDALFDLLDPAHSQSQKSISEHPLSTSKSKAPSQPELTVVMPVLNEAHHLEAYLLHLALCTDRHLIELIIVDGGSEDETPSIGKKFADKFVVSDAGRAHQMNSGAQFARAERLLFLHADTKLPMNALALVQAALEEKSWGFFTVTLEPSKPLLRMIEGNMNRRSRFTKVATGDQCLFTTTEHFRAIGGFPAIPLMEDVAMSKTLRRQCGNPMVIQEPVETSSRRWVKRGVIRTMVLMWLLRLQYFLGVSPKLLHRIYYR